MFTLHQGSEMMILFWGDLGKRYSNLCGLSLGIVVNPGKRKKAKNTLSANSKPTREADLRSTDHFETGLCYLEVNPPICFQLTQFLRSIPAVNCIAVLHA